MECRKLRAGPSIRSCVWVVQHSSRSWKPLWKQGPFAGSWNEEVPCTDASREETQGREDLFFSRGFMPFSSTFLPTTTPWESREAGFSKKLKAAQSFCLGFCLKVLTVTAASSSCVSQLGQYCPLLVGGQVA